MEIIIRSPANEVFKVQVQVSSGKPSTHKRVWDLVVLGLTQSPELVFQNSPRVGNICRL